MVLGLELHATHQNEPEEICVFIVSAGNYLMVNESVLDLLVIFVFLFVISDQNECRVKSTQKISQNKIDQVLVVVEDNCVVNRNESKL